RARQIAVPETGPAAIHEVLDVTESRVSTGGDDSADHRSVAVDPQAGDGPVALGEPRRAVRRVPDGLAPVALSMRVDGEVPRIVEAGRAVRKAAWSNLSAAIDAVLLLQLGRGRRRRVRHARRRESEQHDGVQAEFPHL